MVFKDSKRKSNFFTSSHVYFSFCKESKLNFQEDLDCVLPLSRLCSIFFFYLLREDFFFF